MNIQIYNQTMVMDNWTWQQPNNTNQNKTFLLGVDASGSLDQNRIKNKKQENKKTQLPLDYIIIQTDTHTYTQTYKTI